MLNLKDLQILANESTVISRPDQDDVNYVLSEFGEICDELTFESVGGVIVDSGTMLLSETLITSSLYSGGELGLEGVKEFASNLGRRIWEAIKAFFRLILRGINYIINMFKTLYNKVMRWFGKDVDSVIEELKNTDLGEEDGSAQGSGGGNDDPNGPNGGGNGNGINPEASEPIKNPEEYTVALDEEAIKNIRLFNTELMKAANLNNDLVSNFKASTSEVDLDKLTELALKDLSSIVKLTAVLCDPDDTNVKTAQSSVDSTLNKVESTRIIKSEDVKEVLDAAEKVTDNLKTHGKPDLSNIRFFGRRVGRHNAETTVDKIKAAKLIVESHEAIKETMNCFKEVVEPLEKLKGAAEEIQKRVFEVPQDDIRFQPKPGEPTIDDVMRLASQSNKTMANMGPVAAQFGSVLSRVTNNNKKVAKRIIQSKEVTKHLTNDNDDNPTNH